MTEQLTDNERWNLRIMSGVGPEYAVVGKALRIIDVHAADRAALVAQLEAAEHDTSNARWEMARMQGELNRFEMRASEWALDDAKRRNAIADLNSQLAELTQERDEARENASVAAREMSRCHRLWQEDKVTLERVKALNKSNADVEARSQARLVAEVTRLTEALAAEKQRRAEADRLTLGHVQAKLAAEARVRELEERVSQALTGLRPGSPVREALEEALRAP